MESIGDVIGKFVDMNKFNAMTNKVIAHPEIEKFISENEMTDEEITKSYSKFYEYLKEKEKFDNNEKTAMNGHEPILIMNFGYADVVYRETEEVIKRRKKAEFIKKLNRNSIVRDKTIKKASFKNFKVKTQEEEQALAFAKDIAKYYYTNGEGNTVVSGPAGTGKSHLAMSILKECIVHGDLTVIFASWSEVLHLIKDSFSNKDSFYTQEYFMDIFRNTDLLVIDDIGSEKITDWSMSLLTDVLDARTKTIITTNLNSDELLSKYHNRTNSRIFRGIGKKAFNFKNIKDKRTSQLPF
ncbi:ATP-binding protein [Lactococcus lactis]|uniref:ATP-binding protein n=1 Tax=Lactococcus lactis TaxID=1358 RepID=UPI00288DA514|nr:ATP-binding protein [Lactococcus lactis]MDT2895542.1 ATP-binding protein [Lactococcus lactis]